MYQQWLLAPVITSFSANGITHAIVQWGGLLNFMAGSPGPVGWVSPVKLKAWVRGGHGDQKSRALAEFGRWLSLKQGTVTGSLPMTIIRWVIVSHGDFIQLLFLLAYFCSDSRRTRPFNVRGQWLSPASMLNIIFQWWYQIDWSPKSRWLEVNDEASGTPVQKFTWEVQCCPCQLQAVVGNLASESLSDTSAITSCSRFNATTN